MNTLFQKLNWEGGESHQAKSSAVVFSSNPGLVFNAVGSCWCSGHVAKRLTCPAVRPRVVSDIRSCSRVRVVP